MEIPAYPGFRPLEKSDKAMLDYSFSRLQPRISELTFAGLYLFRKAHDYRLTRLGGSIVIIGRGYDGGGYFLPPFEGNVSAALELLFSYGLTLYGADEAFVSGYLGDSALDIREERDSFDYLYLRQELATLPGNRFHKKKNRIGYFSARHDYEVELLGAQHLGGCLDVLALRGEAEVSDRAGSGGLEADAAREALYLAGELGLEGVVVRVEGVVRAFALGERLNDQTAVCHFEKADPFMEGLAQLVNREFCARLFSGCRFVNREQDLGLMGLRNAKLSYHPVELVKKYRVTSRQGMF